MENIILPLNKNFSNLLSDESKMIGKADFVTFPKSSNQIIEIIHFAQKNNQKIRIQGSLTGITAGAVPDGEIILNLSKMKNTGSIILLEKFIEKKTAYIESESGTTLAELKEKLKNTPYFLPLDPTETSASVGGIVSCNASGALTYKYGSARNWIKSILIALSSGDLLKLERGKNFASDRKLYLETLSGKKIEINLPCIKEVSVKSSAGYSIHENMDIIDLFIGMEGTLGVIIKTEFYLMQKPKICGITIFFKDSENPIDFVINLKKNHKMPIAAIEFFDENSLTLFRTMKDNRNIFPSIPTPSPDFKSAVYVELHFNNNEDIEMDDFLAFLEDFQINLDNTWCAFEQKELDLAKSFRHAFPELVNMKIAEMKRKNPEITKLGTDMSVPDQYLKDIFDLYKSDLEKSNLDYIIFGHIGNNHLHVNIIPKNQNDYIKGKEIYKKWAKFVVQIGGSVSAEHGIGKLKRDFLKIMFSANEIESMKELKKTFDKLETFNKGNIFY